MSEPIRVQLRRSKGWRMPSNTVRVSRPSRWGNPFRLLNEEGSPLIEDTRDGSVPVQNLSWEDAEHELVRLFRDRIAPTLDLTPLRGKNLACWCPIGAHCHADVLLELANAPELGRG